MNWDQKFFSRYLIVCSSALSGTNLCYHRPPPDHLNSAQQVSQDFKWVLIQASIHPSFELETWASPSAPLYRSPAAIHPSGYFLQSSSGLASVSVFFFTLSTLSSARRILLESTAAAGAVHYRPWLTPRVKVYRFLYQRSKNWQLSGIYSA